MRKIYVVYATATTLEFPEGSTIRPFVCIGVASPESAVLSYTIIPETMTYTSTYAGGVEYQRHELRWGSLLNLNVPLQEGALVGIIAGIFAENIESNVYGMFVLSGGLMLE